MGAYMGLAQKQSYFACWNSTLAMASGARSVYEAWLPDTGMSGYFKFQLIFWYGLIGIFFLLSATIMSILGCGYLYYYCHAKTKTFWRKIAAAMFLFSAGLDMMVILFYTHLFLILQAKTNVLYKWVELQSEGVPRLSWFVLLTVLLSEGLVMATYQTWKTRTGELMEAERSADKEYEQISADIERALNGAMVSGARKVGRGSDSDDDDTRSGYSRSGSGSGSGGSRGSHYGGSDYESVGGGGGGGGDGADWSGQGMGW